MILRRQLLLLCHLWPFLAFPSKPKHTHTLNSMSALRSLARSVATPALARPALQPATLQIARPATTLAAGTPRVPSRTPTKYGGVYTVTLIPGDGIGKEITGSVKEVFSSLNVPVEWEEFDVSGETHGSEKLFNEAMESLRRNKVGLKGKLTSSIAASLCGPCRI